LRWLRRVPGTGFVRSNAAVRQSFRSISLLLCLGLAWGCLAAGEDSATAAREAPTPPATGPEIGRGYEIPRLPTEALRLTGAVSSLDELLRTVETALAQRDSVRLAELMVTEREFREILFPAFPAAHPPINADFETVWVLHFPDAVRGMRQLVHSFGGKRMRILNVRFAAPGQDFVNFVLDEESRVDIEVGGRRVDNIRLFGSVYHVGNQYKVLSYPDD
jgi:hypothetical protein